MSKATITIAYAPPDEQTATQLARDLESKGFHFSALQSNSTLIAVISPAGIANDELQQTIRAALNQNLPVVLIETQPTSLPDEFQYLNPISIQGGYKFDPLLIAILKQSPTLANQPPMLRGRNRRFGVIFGGAILLLFIFYTWAIARFDIEAPIEEFERAYTHSAATVGAFAQPFIPRTTEEAQNFEITLQAFEISDELATVIVQTATQAATIGGYTPIPTGLIINPAELSEVRQLATSGAIERATQTAAAEQGEQDSIAATATQAAIDAEATLQQDMLTVTAAGG